MSFFQPLLSLFQMEKLTILRSLATVTLPLYSIIDVLVR